jgi:hypothetical protein
MGINELFIYSKAFTLIVSIYYFKKSGFGITNKCGSCKMS